MARVGRGGLAEGRMLTFGFTPLTQHSLFISLLGPILQAKNAATYSTRGPFIFSGTAASLDFFSSSF